jgi:hypothetical protein
MVKERGKICSRKLPCQYHKKKDEHEKDEHEKDEHEEYDNKVFEEDDNKVFEEDDCTICLDEIKAKNKVVLNCGHIFHYSCISKLKEMSCPICRRSI